MKRQIRLLWTSLALGAAMLSLAAAAFAAGSVTRTLKQTIKVPAGGGVTVENLVGRMRVVQGKGPPEIEATVVAGGKDAQTLAQSVKLDVSRAGKQVRVHVHYPVDHHDTFLYEPPDARATGANELCILGKLICFHGRSSSSLSYQGTRVHVNQAARGGSGTPLYVDVIVRIPAHLQVLSSNAVGLLAADGVADDLRLKTEGGDIHAQNLHGRLAVDSSGGDVYLSAIAVSKAHAHTGGGDLTGNHLSGDVTLSTGGGDARLDTVAGTLSAESGGGDVRLTGDLATLRALDVRTGGGDLNVAGDLAALDSLRAASGGGDITFRASQLSLHLDAASGGGDLHVHLPHMRNVNRSSDRLSAEVGAATGTGSMRSGGGDITVTSFQH